MLFRNKCTACDFWTIFELKTEGDKSFQVCTHCMDQNEVANDGQMETRIRDGEKDVKALEGHFPVLAQLKNRGDHVKF
ncbi:hypothetical protein Pcar_1763 [Syntrophotalea carbinolica DSM 2380]|uniref:Uncharacterized protein n=1 Tax=Syntrophotalea carbinolica (strain DSM 2380 / NBRC 103641 / GraBd1) TaxID=338963 RepID=Q3A3Q1_SYNC1|nr:hypothetical protein [Syntrophotalea carbinolica]ABA89006.1 hypothetical protein Pcar_1763 [Syntrophotalea carbinolica DSM 2380]